MTFSRDGWGAGFSVDKPGVAFVDGLRNTRHITVLANTIAPNSYGKRVLPAHLFMGRYGSAFTFLKRAKVKTTAIATNSPSITVDPELSQLFAANDVLRTVAPFSTLTIAGTWAANDTATATVAGNALTVTAADGVNNNIAAQVANGLNNSPLTNWAVNAIAGANVVYVFGKDGETRHSLAAAETTAGDGTMTAGASALAVAGTIGTVQSVNTTTGVITLTGNAGIALPVGASIGVPPDEHIGIYEFSVDLTNKERYTFTPYTRCDGYYEQSCPQMDPQLKEIYRDRIIFNTRF